MAARRVPKSTGSSAEVIALDSGVPVAPESRASLESARRAKVRAIEESWRTQERVMRQDGALKKQIAAARVEVKAEIAAVTTPAQAAAAKRYATARAAEKARETPSSRDGGDLLTAARVLQRLRGGELLGHKEWRSRWAEDFTALARCLSVVEEKRDCRGLLHPLVSVLSIIVLGSMCDRNDADAIAQWAIVREDWLKTFLPLPNGVPSQDSLLRVMAIVDHRELELALIEWASRFTARIPRTEMQLALDGQTQRRSGSGVSGEGSIHTVSAVLCRVGLCIGQRKTEAKSNEITAAPELLQLLDIRGALVSFDAMGCQVEIASLICQKGGDYLFGLKENQPNLLHQTVAVFEYALDSKRRPADRAQPLLVHQDKAGPQVNAAHGRVEERVATTILRSDNPELFAKYLPDAARFHNLQTLIRIDSTRTLTRTGETTTETRYYVSSRVMTPSEANRAVRSHWHIENKVHYVLDVSFGADQCRVRTDNAAANFGCLRQFALMLLRNHNGDNIGISRRRAMCNDFPRYLEWVLSTLP
jgi:predicted transposase YbfD/YdcC